MPFVAAVLLGWSDGSRLARSAIACDAGGGLDAAGLPWTIRAAEGRHPQLSRNLSGKAAHPAAARPPAENGAPAPHAQAGVGRLRRVSGALTNERVLQQPSTVDGLSMNLSTNCCRLVPLPAAKDRIEPSVCRYGQSCLGRASGC